VVEIVLQLIQSDGSVLGALLHAAVAALMDGGIDLLYLPIATTCLVIPGWYDKDNAIGSGDDGDVGGEKDINTVIRLDPTSKEEDEDSDSSLVVLITKQPDDVGSSSCVGATTIIGSHTVGPGLPVQDFLLCMNVANKAHKAIAAFWRLAIEQKISRETQTLWSK
jgi:hypothetical protein